MKKILFISLLFISSMMIFQCSETGDSEIISSNDCLPDFYFSPETLVRGASTFIEIDITSYGTSCGTWSYDGMYDIYIQKDGVDQTHLGAAGLWSGNLGFDVTFSVPTSYDLGPGYRYQLRRRGSTHIINSDGLFGNVDVNVVSPTFVVKPTNTSVYSEEQPSPIIWDHHTWPGCNNVKIEVWKSGSYYKTETWSTANDGHFGNSNGFNHSFVQFGDVFKVKIIALDGPNVNDYEYSEGTFKVVSDD